MRFRIYTLVDITETNARRGDNPLAFRKHQNFLTVMQTIGLRVNPTYLKSPKLLKDKTSKYNLGTFYKGLQNIWEYEFEIEYEGALTVDMLEKDFDLIPIIVGLDETAEFENATFISQNPKINNIVFELDDK